MSSMYLYCAFQSSEEFSALDTSFMAISFFAGSSRPTQPAAAAVAEAWEGRKKGAAAREAPAATRTVRREIRAGCAASLEGCLTGAPSGGGGWGVGHD